ncbi:MAG: transposase, partial [Ilumatobacteraceae bacterium]
MSPDWTVHVNECGFRPDAPEVTPEFKAELVAMVEASGGKIAQVAHEMRLHDSSVGNWVREPRGQGRPSA